MKSTSSKRGKNGEERKRGWKKGGRDLFLISIHRARCSVRRARPKYVAEVQRPASSLNGQGSGSKKLLDGAARELDGW